MKTNSPEDAEVIVQKLPGDMGIHRNPRKGTLNAPDKILENYDFEQKVMFDEVFPDEFDLEETHRRIEENTVELVKYGKPLVSVGGDHSVSFPVIKVLKQKYPDLRLVWLDSHLDLKERVDGHVSHDVVVRELLENGFEPREIYFVGITRVDQDEESFIEGKEFNIYRADEVEKFLREFKNSEHPVYLSVDIDVLKNELAPGTGYPDGELGLEDVKDVVDRVRPAHADLVEVAPALDREDVTLEHSRMVLEYLLQTTSG